jgi:hypothetical protein
MENLFASCKLSQNKSTAQNTNQKENLYYDGYE